jgi:hypothetical protein
MGRYITYHHARSRTISGDNARSGTLWGLKTPFPGRKRAILGQKPSPRAETSAQKPSQVCHFLPKLLCFRSKRRAFRSRTRPNKFGRPRIELNSCVTDQIGGRGFLKAESSAPDRFIDRLLPKNRSSRNVSLCVDELTEGPVTRRRMTEGVAQRLRKADHELGCKARRWAGELSATLWPCRTKRCAGNMCYERQRKAGRSETPTRAGRLFGASVDPTDARKAAAPVPPSRCRSYYCNGRS